MDQKNGKDVKRNGHPIPHPPRGRERNDETNEREFNSKGK